MLIIVACVYYLPLVFGHEYKCLFLIKRERERDIQSDCLCKQIIVC